HHGLGGTRHQTLIQTWRLTEGNGGRRPRSCVWKIISDGRKIPCHRVFTYTWSSSESSLRRRAFLMGFAVPLRAMSGTGESRVRLTGLLGDGDFCLGRGELSSPEDSSPPASARSS